jgi:tRNA 2-selenouridine synthase SelU
MTADLRRLMRARIQKVGDASPAEMLPQAQQMEKELNAFGRTAAWRALRAQDKKGILEFRGKLRQMIAGGSPSKLELLELLEPFVEFVDAFGDISKREILVQHDQEVLAEVGVVLERATNSTGEEQVIAFKQAIDLGQTLYGRSSEFDAFLRTQRKGVAEPLSQQVEQFLVQIAGLSVY